MMDYEGLYADVASMINRAITAVRLIGDIKTMIQIDSFISECEAFLDEIVARRWSDLPEASKP